MKEKVTTIISIKELVQKDLKDQNDPKMLKQLMNDMQLIENVDFTAEIDKVREKIKLLVDVKNAIDNEMHIK